MGFIRAVELKQLRGSLMLRIEQDLNFGAENPLSEYATEACVVGQIQA